MAHKQPEMRKLGVGDTLPLDEVLEVAYPQELVTSQETPVAPQPDNYGPVYAMINMVERIIANPNVDVVKLEKMLDLQERVLARQNEAAFDAALAEMQADLPEIPRNGEILLKGQKKGEGQKYAYYEDMMRLVLPVMKKYGFSLTHDIASATNKITVTAILAHRQGHKRITALELPCDTSGSKNAVQSYVSAVSYGKRVTSFAILGLSSRGEDNDGNSVEPPAEGLDVRPRVTESQIRMLENALGPFADDWLKLNDLTKLGDVLDDKFTQAHTNAKSFATRRAAVG